MWFGHVTLVSCEEVCMPQPEAREELQSLSCREQCGFQGDPYRF